MEVGAAPASVPQHESASPFDIAIARGLARRHGREPAANNALDIATDRAMARHGTAAWDAMERIERLDAMIAELGRLERTHDPVADQQVEAAILAEIDAGMERLDRGIARERAAIDALLTRMNARDAAERPRRSPAPLDDAHPRSQAEQDLLHALRIAR